MIGLHFLSLTERLVVEGIRFLGEPGYRQAAWGTISPTLHHLGRVAQALGLDIRQPGNRYLSRDEVRLMGYLASQQRRRPANVPNLPVPVAVAASQAAAALSSSSIQLDYRNVARALEIPPPPIEPLLARDETRPLKQQAIELARANGVLSVVMLREVGITRQYLSALKAQGVLELVSPGRYRLGPNAR